MPTKVGRIDVIVGAARIAAGQHVIVELGHRVGAGNGRRITDGEGHRRRAAVAIAVGQGVRKYIADLARGAGVADVAGAAVRAEGEHAILAGDLEVGPGIEIGAVRDVDARNRRHHGAVGAHCVAAAITLGIGDDIAARRVERAGRDGADITHRDRPGVLEPEVGADGGGGRAAVAVAVGQGRGQGDEAVGGQADRVVGVGGIGMDHRPLLVERDDAEGIDRDGEHDRAAGAGTADHLARLEAQHHRVAGGGIDEAASNRQ